MRAAVTKLAATPPLKWRVLTSTATPGTNMATARTWKNFRRAFTLRVGTCLSAASRKSVATVAPLASCGRFGRFGRLGKLRPRGPVESATGVGGALGSLPGPFPLCICVGAPWARLGSKPVVVAPVSLAMLPIGLCLYLRERDSCLFHPATLTQPRAAQYARRAGLVHFVFPSNSQNIAHTHGSRLPKHQRVHIAMRPPTTRTAPA